MDKLLECLSLNNSVENEDVDDGVERKVLKKANKQCSGTITGLFNQEIYEIELDVVSKARVEAWASTLDSAYSLQAGDQVQVFYADDDSDDDDETVCS